MGLIDPLYPRSRLGSGNILDTLCESSSCGRRFLIIIDSIAKPDYFRFNLSAGDCERSPVLLPPKNLAKAGANSRKRSQKGGNPAGSMRRNSKWQA